MKIKRLVGLLADLSPHAYSDSVVLMWLSNCENSILTDVFLVAPEETVEYEEVTEQALLVPHPYDKLYLPYLQAQVAHANQEYDLYSNLMALYNAYRYEYAQYIVQGADPGSGDAVRRGYYLSAYGIAVAHGYAGTEEDWILSLQGKAGKPGQSAYELAVEQGYEGNEEDWIHSLHGEDGVGRSEVIARASDGVSYAANVANYVPEIGTEIVLLPQSANASAPTLSINGGEAYPLCLRPGWNVSGNELRPQLTLPLEAGMLLRGGEYIFRFDGSAWVLQSYISDQKAATALDKASTAENVANAAAEDAEEARLLAKDAEQTAITAISMGNHIIRADTSDGVRYAAPKSDTLPAIATGTAGGHRGKGTRIVLIPTSGPNTAASPTLKIGDGEAIPIRLRSAANKGDNDQAPDATDDIPIGALMAGVPYAMTFCGKYWLIDSSIGGGGGTIYVSDTKPEGLKPGDAWVNTGEELAAPITQEKMETYVNDAIAAALAAIPIGEEMLFG